MINKIISEVQTGADRAGLDVAIRHGFPFLTKGVKVLSSDVQGGISASDHKPTLCSKQTSLKQV